MQLLVRTSCKKTMQERVQFISASTRMPGKAASRGKRFPAKAAQFRVTPRRETELNEKLKPKA
jgi:hypothetical protein